MWANRAIIDSCYIWRIVVQKDGSAIDHLDVGNIAGVNHDLIFSSHLVAPWASRIHYITKQGANNQLKVVWTDLDTGFPNH